MNLVVECLRLSKMAELDLWDIFQPKSKLLSQLVIINIIFCYLLHLPVTLICGREMINSINLRLLIERHFFSKLHRKHFAACPHFVFT